MRKRIFAALLAVALLVTVGVLAVSATTPTVEETIAAAYKCPCHGTPIGEITDWVEFADGVTMEDGKHYRMAAAVTLTDASPLTSNVYVISSGKMVLDTNGFLLNAKSSSYRVFQINDGAELTIVDTSAEQTGQVRGGGNGGNAIIVNGVLNLFGSQLGNRRNTPASTPGNGGVVQVGATGTFNMYGGELVPANGTNTGQIAQKGGAVYIYGGGTYNLYGGVVNSVKVNTDKSTGNGGDAIYIGASTATFNMYGGTVNGLGQGNSPAGESVRGTICQNGNSDGAHIMGGTINGSVYLLYSNNTIKISGDPVIQQVDAGRMTDANEGGIVLGEGGVTGGHIYVLPKVATSNTFISVKNTVDVTSSAPYFSGYSTRSNAAVTADGRLELVANNYCEHCKGDAEWTAWTGASITEAGHYWLSANHINGSSQFQVGNSVDFAGVPACVDLYGHSILRNTNATRAFAVYDNNTLCLMNSTNYESVLNGSYTSGGNLINLDRGSHMNLYSGVTLDPLETTSTSYGGAININGGSLTMHGGTINGGNAGRGAAICIRSYTVDEVTTYGTFTMNGGTINGGAASVYGGALAMYGGGTSNLNGGTINAGTAADGAAIAATGGVINLDGTTVNGGDLANEGNGGAFYLTGSSSLVMTKGTVNGATANGNGGAIYADGADVSVSISGGTVNGGEATLGGGGAVAMINGAALEVSGTALIDGGTGKLGGAVYLQDSGSLTMTGGTITNGAAGQGGNIYITAATAEISGGTVSLGKTDGSTYGGGNILIIGGTSKLTVSGTASIEDGYADASSKDNNRGGGNIFIAGGTVNINGGTVKDGETDASGGNIMTRGGTLNISGGTISGGKAGSGAGYGGDSIALRDNTTDITGGTINSIAPVRDGYTSLTISGAPTITSLDLVGHVNDGIAPVVTLGEGGVTGGSINVVATQDVPFTAANTELATSSCQYFHDAAGELTVIVDDNGQLVLAFVEIPVECPHCHEMLVESDWQAWDGGAILEAGHYYVPEGGISTSGQKQVGDGNVEDNSAVDVCLDLRGNAAHNTGSRMFVLRTKAKLFVMDSVGGGEITGVINASNQKGCVIRVTSGAVFTLHSGTIRDAYTGTRAGRGGAIGAEGADATVNINGGTVTGLTASYGAAIYMEDGAVLNITDGTINGGTASSHGGAICLLGSSMTMSDGTINGGTAHNGGSIYADSASSVTISGDAEITGGKAINNDAIPYGGNIYCAGPFTMTGGTVSNGEASSTGSISRGGNIYVQGSANTHTISGGTISGGISSGNGGNVYIGGGALNISGDVVITNGESQRAIAHSNGGGNVYGLNGTTINITGGTITNGTTASLGGNVFSRGNVTISSAATISGGTAEHEFGGEVAVSGGELTIEGLGDAWSGRITTTNDAVITNDTVGAAVAHYNEGRAYYVWYASLDEVKDEIAAGGENNYVTVTKDSETPVDMSGLVVDLNGKNAVITGNAVIFDSSNDDFEGYGIVTLDNAPATTYVAPNGYMYISVSEGENKYSFHRVEMGFENISLRPSTGGIYFSSNWNCDDILSGKLVDLDWENGKEPIILGYGLALKKGSAATSDSFTNGDKFAYTFFDNIVGDDMLYDRKGDEINSCLLNNIISVSNDATTNQANAQVDIYVTPYVQIINSDGEYEYVMGDIYFNDMKGIVEYFVETIAAMQEGAAKDKLLAGMTSFYETWSATDAYGLNGFFNGLESLVVPAE